MGKTKQRSLYLDIASQANAPLNERKDCVQGRDGVRKIPRRYHLKASEIVELKREMQEKGRFISPYGTGRIYTYIIESLVVLGAGKPHSFPAVYDKFVELASAEETRNDNGFTLWDRFEKKTSRNQDTGRDPRGKFMQNLEVLQRLGGDHPYALKLAQVGACIDILVDAAQEVKIVLRTGIADGDIVHPVNLNRKRKYTKTVDEVQSGIIIDGDDSIASSNDDTEE